MGLWFSCIEKLMYHVLKNQFHLTSERVPCRSLLMWGTSWVLRTRGQSTGLPWIGAAPSLTGGPDVQATHNVMGCRRESKCCRSQSRGCASFLKTWERRPGSCRQTVGLAGRRTAELFARNRAQKSNVDAARVGREGKLSDRGGQTKASESTASPVGPAADGRESDLSGEAGGAQPPTNTQLPAEGPARLDRAWDFQKRTDI